MTGQRIGYIRVSTFDQNPERQLEGVKVDVMEQQRCYAAGQSP
jgi:DNA invertase Pin-like site-specific DNA recombinase